MSFKSLIIFALVASLGRVMAAPIAGEDLGARNPCQGIWCARFILGDRHSGLARRQSDDNITFSSDTPGDPYGTPLNPSSTTSSVDPASTPFVDPFANPSSTPSFNPLADPSSTPSVDPLNDPSSTPPANPFLIPSSTSDGTPLPTDPAAGGVVTITVTSTVFLNPTQSPAPPNSVFSLSPPADPSSTLSGDPSSSTPSDVSPGGVVVLNPALSQPDGVPSSSTLPASTPSPSVVLLVPSNTGSSVSPDPADQPTPSPTTGIVFLPPSGDDTYGS